MKRYIKSSTNNFDNVMTLSELLSNVNMEVVFVDTFSVYNRSAIEGSTRIDYNQCSDARLLRLDESEIHSINDIQTLIRIAKLSSDLLTPTQQAFVDKELRKKVIISKSDVKAILEDLKSKRFAYFMPNHRDNEDFLQDNGISPDDALYAVQHLTIGDYVANTTNIIPKYYGDELIIFEPKRALPLRNGNTLKDVIIYIKIDLDKSLKDGVYLISFHSTNREDRKPYK